MAPETRTVLEELSKQEGILVCVVSGRSLADVKSRVGLSSLVYSGNHGLEIESDSLRFVHPEAGRGRAAIEDLNRRVAGLPLLIPGVQLEPKGLSTTIHFRRADPTAHDQIETIARSLVPADHLDLMVTEGKMNYEVRPRLDWNKGSAVRWIHERIKDRAALAFVIGDDRTDEDAFRAWPTRSRSIWAQATRQPPATTCLTRAISAPCWAGCSNSGRTGLAPPIPPHSPTSAGRLWH